jgi:7-carboxy-7-deazaguanine synthase (Cx14CxxC type)
VSYAVKEIFYTLQGEGAHTGRAAVFCRFAGCNLWSGREQDRADAVCRFCDTEFVGTDGDGGGKFTTADELAAAVAAKWAGSDAAGDSGRRFVVCTGGEPLLQLDAALIEALHRRGFTIAIETNGTIAVPEGVDWVCVSPKANAELVVTRGDELKVVYPQEVGPEVYAGLEFAHFFVQPMDGANAREAVQAAIRYCAEHPQWRLSLQTHKMIGIR